MSNLMGSKAKVWLIPITVVIIAVLAGFWASTIETRTSPFEPRPFPDRSIDRRDIQLFYTVRTVVSSVNVTLLAFLLTTYVSIYRKTQSEFTVGLILFSMVLLLYALTSNPLVQTVFGFQAYGLGPFAMLPDMFSAIALAVLLYLTLKY
jgi:hypothetical protein